MCDNRPKSSASSSSSSINSSKSKKRAAYSHLLYLSDADRQSYLQNSTENMTSRFSSSSNSANSSAASLHASQSHSKPSTKPSSVNSSADSFKATSAVVSKIATLKYADTHYPLITHTSAPDTSLLTDPNHSALGCARLMANLHNTIIRAFNSAYNHALLVSPQQNLQRTRDYIVFCQTLHNFIEHHHHTEEEFFFPKIEALIQRPGAMDENVKGHELFTPGLEAWGAYVNDPATPTKYSGVELRRLLEAFAPEFIEHLHDEIRTLSQLALDPKCPSKELQKILEDTHKYANKDSDLYKDGPWMLGCQDRDFQIDGKAEEHAWPPIPWVIGRVVRKWHARRFRGAWEFCPADFDGNRRLLKDA